LGSRSRYHRKRSGTDSTHWRTGSGGKTWLLEQRGLVISFRGHKDRKCHELTEQGEKFGQMMDTARRHTDGWPVTQIVVVQQDPGGVKGVK